MPRWSVDYITGLILRYGVISSIALILLGIALLNIRGEALGCNESLILSARSPINTSVIPPIYALSRLPNLDPLSFIILGLVILISTIVFMVVFNIVSFIVDRDWLYVLLSMIVFTNLMLAIFILPSILHLHAHPQLLKMLCQSSK